MSTSTQPVPSVPTAAVAPRGVNHLVLNVRDLEVSHTFWTEIMGFKCVAELKNRAVGRCASTAVWTKRAGSPTTTLPWRRYRPPTARTTRREWKLLPSQVGLNHVAVAWPDRESWLKQIAFMQSRGVPFLRRVNHGMTHSVYIADPNGHGIEVLYELPREVWEERHRRGAELRRAAPHRG